ncbi:hypothetical protein R1flu_014041 [Riccia fluitans]|uniref:RING-type E3 ubiquitin transferase n=1 Tax=Riccia fluitans TaxID=41844 RepID=A0ABD1YFC1_9MARC
MLLLWIITALLHPEHVQTGQEYHIIGRVLLSDSNQPGAPRQDSNRGLNPSVVIIVVILTVVFLLSGFLHLLARCCGRVASRHEPTESAMSALHGQLQHLFHLHDSGVDQAFIDTLPVFPYKAICGLKEGTDCAVCLSEFESEDRLRLLPKCKHAFHIDCIDTWLLSHSTCPLCRCALLSDDVSRSNRALSDSGRLASNRSMGSHSGFVGDSRRTVDMSRRIASSSLLAEHGGGSGSELGKDDDNRMRLDSPEIQPVLDATDSNASVASVLSVKLGRVERRAHNNSHSSSILRGRSYSMGSYEYVVDPANLQVVIAPTPYPGRGRSREVASGMPRHRSVFSDSIPELGSNPGTPADELFWATRGLATPEFVARPDGSGTSRLNLGPLAPEASLMPKRAEVDEKLKGKDKDWVTIDLEAKEASGVVINRTILPDKAPESEESRILAGLERFFGSGWRSNVGLERLAESMLKRPVDGSSKSKATSALGESQRDHSMSRRTFSFRFPVPDSLRGGRSSRRTMSDNGGYDTTSKETVAFDTASSKDTGYETASKEGGFETASKESVAGLDTSSVGSFDSSWVGPSQPLAQPISNAESNQHAASLARKTIHWLMGRDRRVVGHATFSPSPEAGIQRRDEP